MLKIRSLSHHLRIKKISLRKCQGKKYRTSRANRTWAYKWWMLENDLPWKAANVRAAHIVTLPANPQTFL